MYINNKTKINIVFLMLIFVLTNVLPALTSVLFVLINGKKSISFDGGICNAAGYATA